LLDERGAESEEILKKEKVINSCEAQFVHAECKHAFSFCFLCQNPNQQAYGSIIIWETNEEDPTSSLFIIK